MRHALLLALIGLALGGCSKSPSSSGTPPGGDFDGAIADPGATGLDAGVLPDAGILPDDGPTADGGAMQDGGALDEGPAPALCGSSGAACSRPTDCCMLACNGGQCGAAACKSSGAACSVVSDCCSGTCSGGTCQLLAGGACKTLGEACSGGTDCCSTNCRAGVCERAYACQGPGDVCWSASDCCGGACTAQPGSPGRCVEVTGAGGGGCSQDGTPCSSGSNCCSRICRDPGSGVTVCQAAGGCRLTGDWCFGDDQCCGGGPNPNGSVQCAADPAIALGGRCTQGNACNPVGNICGAPVLPDGGKINAPQDCCDGQKDVCKVDSTGIPRCFGGKSAQCAAGYDPNVAGCCIAPGGACQFRDQCCGLAPCLPTDGGGFACATPEACTPLGGACTAADPCCDGAACVSRENGSYCAMLSVPPPPDGGSENGGTADGGTADAGAPDAGSSDAGFTCVGNGSSCTSAAECCSAVCTGGTCVAPLACRGAGDTCTSTADCCVGTLCQVPAGQTTGSCSAGPSCPSLGQQCGVADPCCTGFDCFTVGTTTACDGQGACSCVWLPVR